MEKKQTAVQWLIKELKISGVITSSDLEKAEMWEREQIEQAYNKGTINGIDYPESKLALTGEQYYNKTYGKGGAK